MGAPVYLIPAVTLRRLERFLDYFESDACPHSPGGGIAPVHDPETAAAEECPPFQTIGNFANKIVSDVAQRRGVSK